MNFYNEYPNRPPRCRLPPGFFHPNVVIPDGDVRLPILDADRGWVPDITVEQILVGIQNLLDQPNVADFVQGEASVLFNQGMDFDLEKGSALFIDLAKSNSRSKRQRTDDERLASDKKHKGSPAILRDSFELGSGSFHIPGMSYSAYNTIGYPSAQSHWSYTSRGISEANASKSSHSSASHIPQDNPPCPTIFVGNLGPGSSEQELTQLFSRCRGFLKLIIQGTYGDPVAFVDFQDTACSTEALGQLQGTTLFFSSTGDGLRLEFAKSRMGMRRKPK